MPASICDPVSSALRLSLATDESQSSSLLDSRLFSSAKSVLLSKIEFEESGDYQSNVLDGLKSKYVVIRPKKPVLEAKIVKKDGSSGSSDTKPDDSVPRAKITLFHIEKVQVGWQGAWSAGTGIQNVGNTCYLNSTLQALFHVPAFANWLVSEGPHADKCNQKDGCVICGMRETLLATQKSANLSIKPWMIYSKLRLICKHLTPGRQEDAHEFLRYLVEAMEKCYLTRFAHADKLDQYSKETTPLNQILGGYLRSTVRCLACHHLSTTYSHFQDLLLDIRKHSTLEEALDSFFSRERLEDLGYKCEACNKKVSATKQFFVERAPMVLCIALKRFSLAGGKLSKHVQFRKKISLLKYMHNKNTQQSLNYKLVSMVTHLGSSQHCGHYTAIGQAPNSNYYQFDDGSVRPLPLSSVLANNAYIMFFERDNSNSEDLNAASTSSAVYGPQLPDNIILKRDKSPLKVCFFRNEERKPTLLNSSTTIESVKPDPKPIILNGTLIKSSNANSSNSEPWVVKQNGEVVKVTTAPKILNGSDKTSCGDDNKKICFTIKQSHNDDCGKTECKDDDTELCVVVSTNVNGDKPINKMKAPKSPLEKLEEQMNNNIEVAPQQRNGNCNSKLVPYDSESESGDEKGDKNKHKPSCGTTTAPTWIVLRESDGPQLSPSLNGDTNNSVKEKEKGKDENQEIGDENEKSLNTSLSTMSPLSDHSNSKTESNMTTTISSTSALTIAATTTATTTTTISTTTTITTPTTAASAAKPPSNGLLSTHDTARHLQTMSHRGYGTHVDTWTGSRADMGRQVFEERRIERKRALDGVDEMDRGRVKKTKKFHHYNRFNNNRNNYNPFQEKQNMSRWVTSSGHKYRDHRPHFVHKRYNNKYKHFNNRYNNGHHYSRRH